MSNLAVGLQRRTSGRNAVTCVTLSCVGLMLLAAYDPPKDAKSTQEVASARIEATVQQIAWISGAWDGEGLGGTVEEHWTNPGGGSLVGVFRLIGADNKMKVCELLMIEQQGKQVVYRFRHFGPGHTPWEELDKPLVFDLIRLTPTEAVFESSVQTDPKRLTYSRDGDKMTIRVQGEKEGVLGKGFELSLTRTKLDA